jgi:hypothetical protein
MGCCCYVRTVGAQRITGNLPVLVNQTIKHEGFNGYAKIIPYIKDKIYRQYLIYKINNIYLRLIERCK